MIAEIGAGLTSLNAAAGLLKTLNAAATQAAINDVKLELQELIFAARDSLASAREAQTASLERIRELEQQIMQFQNWEVEKQSYQLMAVEAGAFAYVHKPGMENGEPPHWLCTACFSKRHRGFLRTRGNEDGGTGRRTGNARWACDTCKGEITVFYSNNPAKLAGLETEPPPPEPPPARVSTVRVVRG